MARGSPADLCITIWVKITQHGPDGKEILPPLSPPAKWIPALRFYRLSQASRSPHEAYRNLWLGFEALLSSSIPKARKEQEKVWLRRALNQLTSRLDLTRDIPDGENPVDYIMKRHYTDMRCNLFHAKIAELYTAPQMPTAQEALDAYAEIVQIWRAIAFSAENLHVVGSGFITHIGYADLTAAAFSKITFCATDDPALPTPEDVAVSPNNHEVITFDSSQHIGMVAPGRVENLGIIDVSSKPSLPLFRRVTMNIGDTPCCIEHLGKGIDLQGVDRFEYRQIWRLLNTGTPRTNFD